MRETVVSSDLVQLRRQEAIGILCLNRPEVHNVVNSAVIERLEALLDEIDEYDEIHVLILTGAGYQSFCAGADLTHLATLEDTEEGLVMSRRMQTVLHRLAIGPRPVIAAVNGSALGGGCEILTACHLRISAWNARFSFRQAAMGLITGWGGGMRLIRLLGRSQALRLLLTAETIDAAEALRLGLVDRVVPPDRLLDEALNLGQQIAANSSDSVRSFLQLVNATDEAAAKSLAELEEQLYRRLWHGDHFRRKVVDWQERRLQRKR